MRNDVRGERSGIICGEGQRGKPMIIMTKPDMVVVFMEEGRGRGVFCCEGRRGEPLFEEVAHN